MQNSTTFGQIFISYFAKLQNFRQNFNFMSCKILWNSRKSLRNSRKILRNYENEGKIVYSYLTYFHAQTTRQNGPQKRNTTYELLFKLLKISHNTPTKHSHPTLSNNTLKQHSQTTLSNNTHTQHSHTVLWSRLEPDFFAGAGAGEKASAPGCCSVA